VRSKREVGNSVTTNIRYKNVFVENQREEEERKDFAFSSLLKQRKKKKERKKERKKKMFPAFFWSTLGKRMKKEDEN